MVDDGPGKNIRQGKDEGSRMRYQRYSVLAITRSKPPEGSVEYERALTRIGCDPIG